MKRIFCFLAATATIGLFCFSSNVNATSFTQTDAGEPVEMTVATAGAPNFSFNPSTNVILLGNSVTTSFAIWAHHQQVLNKASGQQYGMTSAVNKMYFLDISSSTTAYTSATATNSAAFSTFTEM